jgi:WW domain-containing oxidoreductase
MKKAMGFDASATADQVLAGIDLSGRRFLVTGCASGIGLETLSALTANGAHVFGLARDAGAAAAACKIPGAICTPLGCDLADLDSVVTAAKTVVNQGMPLDAIIANAAIADAPLESRNGLESHFAVNHLGHFALINELLPMVRDGGRIVIVSDASALARASHRGIAFDNLDGSRGYDPGRFYAQSKLANVLFAAELAARVRERGISVNVALLSATRSTGLHERRNRWVRIARWLPDRLVLRAARQSAATPCLLAASPTVSGISGEYWANCRITKPAPAPGSPDLARRLWEFSAEFVARHLAQATLALQRAA